MDTDTANAEIAQMFPDCFVSLGSTFTGIIHEPSSYKRVDYVEIACRENNCVNGKTLFHQEYTSESELAQIIDRLRAATFVQEIRFPEIA